MFKGILPLSNGYNLFAKAGYARVMRDDMEVDGTSVSDDSKQTYKVFPLLVAVQNIISLEM